MSSTDLNPTAYGPGVFGTGLPVPTYPQPSAAVGDLRAVLGLGLGVLDHVLVVVPAARTLVVAEVAGEERAGSGAAVDLADGDHVAALALDAGTVELAIEVVDHELVVHLGDIIASERAEVRGRCTAPLARRADSELHRSGLSRWGGSTSIPQKSARYASLVIVTYHKTPVLHDRDIPFVL